MGKEPILGEAAYVTKHLVKL